MTGDSDRDGTVPSPDEELTGDGGDDALAHESSRRRVKRASQESVARLRRQSLIDADSRAARLGGLNSQTVQSLRNAERAGKSIADRVAGLDPGGTLGAAIRGAGGDAGRIGRLADDPTSGLGKTLADVRRAQQRLDAARSRDERPLIPRVSEMETLKDVAAQERAEKEVDRERERAQHEAAIEAARERHEALVDVIATSAAASQEATVAVQRSIEQMAFDSKATQDEALRIARESKTATLVGVWVSVLALVVTSTIAIIAIVVASPTP